MRASRLLSILMLLQAKVRLTAEALAEEFEVSVRTIYRDVEALGAAGIPIYADRGPGGGFQLVEGYRTRLPGLATDEAEAMLMIGLPGQAAALGLGEAAHRARGKLMAALPATMSEGAGRMGARFHLDATDWYREAEAAPHLPAMTRAVLDQRRIAMRYESWTATRDWQIEPLGLVLKAGAWYAVAASKGVSRIFKVSNIRTLTLLDERFERPKTFDLAAHWTQALQRFEAQLRPRTATLAVTAAGLERLGKLGAYATAAIKQVGRADAQGWARLSWPIEHIEQAALMLLGIGPEVRVIDPPELRERLHALARDVSRLAQLRKTK